MGKAKSKNHRRRVQRTEKGEKKESGGQDLHRKSRQNELVKRSRDVDALQSRSSQNKRPRRPTAESTPPPPEWQGVTTKSFLTPLDGAEFSSCLETSYKGFVSENSAQFPKSFHDKFDACLDSLHDEGLFLYDAVQSGGKRVSKTYVKRTLIGEPGSTYRYLGLRLFSHPWRLEGTDDTNSALTSIGYTAACSRALLQMGELNQSLVERTRIALEREMDAVSPGPIEYNLTLVNRMAPTAVKKNLKQENQYGMGKTSVSWHKDSGLVDFSSIAVYHSLRNEGDSESSFSVGDPWRVALRVADSSSKTPPLAVPLESGAVYYLLHEFNHNHEHAVLAGSNEVYRYSSTHRVAREGQGTWQYLRKKCQGVIDKKTQPASSKQFIKVIRSEQQLMTEIEFEWLRQWYVQGRIHASLHRYWLEPVRLLESWFEELERRTVKLIERMRCKRTDDSLLTEDVFDILIDSMVAREKQRDVWRERLQHPLYQKLPEEARPFPCPVLDRSAVTVDDQSKKKPSTLSEDLPMTISELRRLRERFTARAESTSDSKRENAELKSSNKSQLTKREGRSVASNWELMKASMEQKKK